MKNYNILGSYLESTIPEFHGLKSVKKFDGGQSNPTFLIQCNSGKYVLRSKPKGILLKSAHAIDREFKVMQALNNSNVPVPKMLHLCDDKKVIGSEFFVMSFIEGHTFWDPALPNFSNNERREIYNQICKVLIAIHKIDYNHIGLSDFGKPGNYFKRQYKRWTGQYHASQTENIKEMEYIISWLKENMVEEDGRIALVHGDYRLDNFLFEPNEGKILAVVDWELSTIGHPFSDIAFLCALLRMKNNSALSGLGGIDRESLGIPSEKDYLAIYCNAMGIQSIENWDFYIVFSLFRMASIVQGVRKRAIDGNASSTLAHKVGSLVTPLSKMASDIIKHN